MITCPKAPGYIEPVGGILTPERAQQYPVLVPVLERVDIWRGLEMIQREESWNGRQLSISQRDIVLKVCLL